jgi:hypothetical protein
MRLASWDSKLLIMIVVMTFSTRAMFAVDCSLGYPGLGVSSGNVFNLDTAGFANSEIQTAIDYWGCPGYTGYIPTFQIGSGDVPVSIIRIVGRSTARDGGCGEIHRDIVNGYVESAEITVWTKESDGDPCPNLPDVLAHEFGHLLGLADAPDIDCAGLIMGRALGSSARIVRAEDCAIANQKWETTMESQPPEDPYCNAYCWTTCVNNACPSGNPWCPILVDMENDGIHLTGLDDPVWFDIDADGDRDLMSWTDRSEGLLVLDRNVNGLIDNGSELFGNATRLANGTQASNGYVALAEFDSWAFGGNGNGAIDPADSAFSSLRIWTDLNHDGNSQPEELQTLDAAGIRRIGLDYRQSRRRDRYGNEFRFLGTAWKDGHLGVAHPILTWDVFFLVAP